VAADDREDSGGRRSPCQRKSTTGGHWSNVRNTDQLGTDSRPAVTVGHDRR